MASPDSKTLWVGDIETWMDENYLTKLLATAGDVATVKIVRDRSTQYPAGYGFVEFTTHASAARVLEALNGKPIPGSNKVYRLNWATFASLPPQKPSASSASTTSSAPIPGIQIEHSIFIGDLGLDVTDSMLEAAFAKQYSTVRGAKVVYDTTTCLSKGYGFVRFGDEKERFRAMSEMQGMVIGSRPIRISQATQKNKNAPTAAPAAPSSPTRPDSPTSTSSSTQVSSPAINRTHTTQTKTSSSTITIPPDGGDGTITTIFVGGLDISVDEHMLRSVFAPYGELSYVKIPHGNKGCGFVQFTTRAAAESAFALNGTYIGHHPVRLSWGKYSSKPQESRDLDFTQPPDISTWNEEYMECREDQFIEQWQWRRYNGIAEFEGEDGPDPILYASYPQ